MLCIFCLTVSLLYCHVCWKFNAHSMKDPAWSITLSRCCGNGGLGGLKEHSAYVGHVRFLSQSRARGEVSLLAKEATETSCLSCCSIYFSGCSVICPINQPSSLFSPLFSTVLTLVFSCFPSLYQVPSNITDCASHAGHYVLLFLSLCRRL